MYILRFVQSIRIFIDAKFAFFDLKVNTNVIIIAHSNKSVNIYGNNGK